MFRCSWSPCCSARFLAAKMPTAIDTIRGSGTRFIVLVWHGQQSYVADKVGRGISELYSGIEAFYLAQWLNQRDAGYPSRLPSLSTSPFPARPNCKGPCCRKPPKRVRRV